MCVCLSCLQNLHCFKNERVKGMENCSCMHALSRTVRRDAVAEARSGLTSCPTLSISTSLTHSPEPLACWCVWVAMAGLVQRRFVSVALPLPALGSVGAVVCPAPHGRAVQRSRAVAISLVRHVLTNDPNVTGASHRHPHSQP